MLDLLPPSPAEYSARWRRARLRFLRANPLCVFCYRLGRVVEATQVDHIIPHKGDRNLFWQRANWQPLCTSCHSSKTQREQAGMTAHKGADTDGIPFDPAHPWSA